jgi:thiol-disulfide isomerase/thioredoxin
VATVGLPTPPIVVRGLRGDSVETASLRGKPLFINFFATWCLPCKVETPMFVSEYPKYKNRVNFLSIDLEEQPSAVRAFVVRYKIPWTIGIDSGQTVMRYGVVSLPESVFIDRDGIVRAIYRGYMQPGNFWQDVALIAK